MKKNYRILITGAEGLLGKNLIGNADFNKNEIIATGQGKEKILTFIKGKYPDVEVQSLDVLDTDKCISTIKGVDIVVHLAAIIDIGRSLDEPKKFIDVNYIGTLNVLEAMRINKIKKIIFPSTQDVYGNNINIEEEADNLSPLNAYSLSKLLCEQTIKMYSDLYGINYAIFRASHLYGKYQKRGIVPLFSERVLENDKVEIGNNVKRDFFNVEDFVSAVILALGWRENYTFNLGTGSSTSLKELIGIIAGILDRKIEIITNKNLSRDEKFERWDEVADITKIKKLGWAPKHDLRGWLKENLQST